MVGKLLNNMLIVDQFSISPRKKSNWEEKKIQKFVEDKQNFELHSFIHLFGHMRVSGKIRGLTVLF